MTEAFPTYDRDPQPPQRPVPPKSVDTHMHVYGDPERFPVRTHGSVYSAPDGANMETYLAMRRTIGIERTVYVHPTLYGTDYALLKDTLRTYGESHQVRGVAIVDDTTTDADLADLHALGVRGARFNFPRKLGVRPSMDAVRRTIDRIGQRGWFAKIFCMPNDLIELADDLQKIDTLTVIDHMGRLTPGDPVSEQAFAIIMDFLKSENWWVQLSNGDRSSRLDAGWSDVVPHARAMYDAAPQRCIWGTDWPHTEYRKSFVPNDGALVDLLETYLPDDEARLDVFSRNPSRLFGFDA